MPHNIEEMWSQAKPIGTNGPIGTGISVGTPDMSIIDGGRRPPPELPMNEVFGAAARWIREQAESKSVPVDYVMAGYLGCVSTILGNRRWAKPWASWREPSCLWLAPVGDPSSGKSPGIDASLNHAREIEAEMAMDFPETLRRYERDREAAAVQLSVWKDEVKEAVKAETPAPEKPQAAEEPDRPERPRLIVSDTTTESLGRLLAGHPAGLMFHRDELAGWLGGFDKYGGGGERAFWIEAYGGRPYVIDRVKHQGDPIQIPHLTISILGGIQPERLSTMLLASEDDGLPSRFLMVWPNAVVPERPRHVPDDYAARSSFRRLMQLQMSVSETGQPTPVTVPFSDKAADLLDEWRKANYIETQGAAGMYLSHLGKLPGIAVRLSCILEFMDWSWQADMLEPPAISMTSTARALHLIDSYFKPMAERVYGDAALPQVERDAAMIGRAIRSKGIREFNARSARRAGTFGSLKDGGRINRALEVLIEAGWIQEVPAREGDTSGRSRRDYTVNPAIHGAA